MATNVKANIIAAIEFNMDGAPAVSDDTPLIGPTGILDSIGFVGVMVDLQDLYPDVNFTSDNAMNPQTSPFRTLATLIDYINEHTDNGSK